MHNAYTNHEWYAYLLMSDEAFTAAFDSVKQYSLADCSPNVPPKVNMTHAIISIIIIRL